MRIYYHKRTPTEAALRTAAERARMIDAATSAAWLAGCGVLGWWQRDMIIDIMSWIGGVFDPVIQLIPGL